MHFQFLRTSMSLGSGGGLQGWWISNVIGRRYDHGMACKLVEACAGQEEPEAHEGMAASVTQIRIRSTNERNMNCCGEERFQQWRNTYRLSRVPCDIQQHLAVLSYTHTERERERERERIAQTKLQILLQQLSFLQITFQLYIHYYLFLLFWFGSWLFIPNKQHTLFNFTSTNFFCFFTFNSLSKCFFSLIADLVSRFGRLVDITHPLSLNYIPTHTSVFLS